MSMAIIVMVIYMFYFGCFLCGFHVMKVNTWTLWHRRAHGKQLSINYHFS